MVETTQLFLRFTQIWRRSDASKPKVEYFNNSMFFVSAENVGGKRKKCDQILAVLTQHTV